jgi:hypothetical protein
MEQFDLTQGATGTTTRVNRKATGFKLVVAAGAGDDSFHVGGGDFDSNQFATANTLLAGGDGIDSIRFDDRFDDYENAANENEVYTLENNSFRKDLAALLYFTFESQTILTADVLSGNSLIDNTINLNKHSFNIEQTTIIGGSVRGNGVYVSTGNITNLAGNFAFHLGASRGNAVYLNDQADTQQTAWSFTSPSTCAGGRSGHTRRQSVG